MAYREYIGSRYVPIFGRKNESSIAWDNSGTYEPLTIVLYQGNSYTSRQYVPIGVDIHNEEYWALTGNYNAQVEQYRQEVNAFDNRISNNTDNIATNAENIATNAHDIVVLDAKVDTEIGELDTKIDNEIDELDNKIDTETELLDNKIDEVIKLSNAETVIPYCMGYIGYNDEYTAYDHPGAICEVSPGRQVIISSPNTQPNNYGHFRSISIEDNLDNYTNISQKTLGHANSICYDGEYLYVAPVWKWNSGGTRENANCVYKCDVNGTLISEIPVSDANIMGVSFDPITTKLYFLGYDKNIYEYDKTNNTLTVVESTNATPHYNQDFAIYNGIYYISSPQGNLLQGYIGGNGFKKTLIVDKTDASNHIPLLGELDGMEFKNNGELLAIFHVDDSSEHNNTCFITALPVNNLTTLIPYIYRFTINRDAFTQFCQSYNTILRPDGTEQSPHKGLAIRKVFYPQYIRFVATDNMKVYGLREIGKMLIHINANCKLEILNNLYNQNEIVFDGGTTATIKFPFPISVANTGKTVTGFTSGLTIVNSNTSRYLFSSAYTGCELLLGSHTLANESEYTWASNATGHTLKQGVTIANFAEANLW